MLYGETPFELKSNNNNNNNNMDDNEASWKSETKFNILNAPLTFPPPPQQNILSPSSSSSSSSLVSPSQLSLFTVSFIKNLLDRNVQARLGSSSHNNKGGIDSSKKLYEDIEKHPFFNNKINFNLLENRSLPAPKV
jgi:hypothetical protein